MDSFPPELIENIISHLPRNDKLALRKVSRILNSAIAPRIPELIKSERCDLIFLQMHTIGEEIRLMAQAANFESAQHFVVLDKAAESVRRGKNREQIDCFVRIELPRSISKTPTLFQNTKIGRFIIDNMMSFYFEDGNAEILTHLLRGCTVGEAVLILDQRTIRNLSSVCDFLKSVNCKSVEFLMKMQKQPNILTFCPRKFATSLAAVGVEAISFTGEQQYSRDGQATPFPFDLLLALVNVGISQIVVHKSACVAWDEPKDSGFLQLQKDIASSDKKCDINASCCITACSLAQNRVVGATRMTCNALNRRSLLWQVTIKN